MGFDSGFSSHFPSSRSIVHFPPSFPLFIRHSYYLFRVETEHKGLCLMLPFFDFCPGILPTF